MIILGILCRDSRCCILLGILIYLNNVIHWIEFTGNFTHATILYENRIHFRMIPHFAMVYYSFLQQSIICHLYPSVLHQRRDVDIVQDGLTSSINI